MPNINQPDNKTVQPGSEPARIEAMGNTLCDVMTFPSACQQLNQVGTRLIDRETNMSDIEVRSQREETRVDDSSNDEVIVPSNRNAQIPVSHSNMSLYNTKLTGGSHMRTCDTEMVPQLDGPMSVRSRRRMSENVRTEQKSSWRIAVIHRREYPDESSNSSYSGRRTYDDRRPPKRRYQEGNGRPPDGGYNHDRRYSRRGRPLIEVDDPPNNVGSPDGGGPHDNGRPPDDGGHPDEGGTPDDGGPLDDGEPPGNGQYPRYPGR